METRCRVRQHEPSLHQGWICPDSRLQWQLASSVTLTFRWVYLRVSPLASYLLTSCRAGSCAIPPSWACMHAIRRAVFGVPPVYRTLNYGRRVACGSWAAWHRGGSDPAKSCPANTLFAQRFRTDVPESPGNGTVWDMAIRLRCSKNPGIWDRLEHDPEEDGVAVRERYGAYMQRVRRVMHQT